MQPRRIRPSLHVQEISIEEGVTSYIFACCDRNRLIEHGPGVGEGMELAVLAAGVDGCRHAAQQVRVKIASDEICG